jgi:hypothetical protein
MQGAWRLFWDQQLLKVLDAQFARDIPGLHTRLPVLRISMVFLDRALQYEPCIEEIRGTLYQTRVDTVISLPGAIRGFSPAHECPRSPFFRSVLERNAAAVVGVYTHIEGVLFAGLKRLLARFQPWVAVGLLDDVHSFVAARCTNDAASFEREIEGVKQMLRELQRGIPAEVQEGCFKVNLGPLKSAVEEQCGMVRDSLAATCRDSALRDRDAVADFCRAGRELLARQAGSLSELGEVRVQVRTISCCDLGMCALLCAPRMGSHHWAGCVCS